jgi:adenine-specific DNA methylase
MVWDFFELNPFSLASQGTFPSMFRQSLKSLEFLTKIDYPSDCTVRQSSAISLPYPNNYFDAVFTDPPYYDNVPYSHLSDFFYVWMKRALAEIYPDLFATPLTPKAEEIVAYSNSAGESEAGKLFFEEMLRKAFVEIDRVLKPNGITTVVYAHKSTAGWETLINSLLDSGLVVVGAWPIHTEMKGRLRSKESAALASSIYMVVRKTERAKVGFYKEVKQELTEYLHERLDALWKDGISGADFLIAAIGSSIQVFGRFQKIIDDEGKVIRADKFLEDLRKIVTDYAVKQVLHDGFAEAISPMTRFYILWRWAYGQTRVHFDDARKISQSVGIDLTEAWNRGFVQKDKEFIVVLGPDDRDVGKLDSKELIDVLHDVLLLWKKGRNEDVLQVLKETGFGKSDAFYRVAQAISESLPTGSSERSLLEGFLQGKQRLSEDIRAQSEQTKLFE